MSNKSSTRSFFRNAFNTMIAARERQAELYVARMTNLYGNDFYRLGDQKNQTDLFDSVQ